MGPNKAKNHGKSTNSGSQFDGIGGYFQWFRRGVENCKTFMRRFDPDPRLQKFAPLESILERHRKRIRANFVLSIPVKAEMKRRKAMNVRTVPVSPSPRSPSLSDTKPTALAHDELYKGCRCSKHLRWTHGSQQYRQAAKTRTWSVAEERRHEIEPRFLAADPTQPIETVKLESQISKTIERAVELFLLRIVSGLAENTNSIFCEGSSEPETANGCLVLPSAGTDAERHTVARRTS
jgi:hypothetical protein